jgi:hypothetical protein
MLPDKHAFWIRPDGQYSSTLPMANRVVYVAQTDKGQELFTPEEFATKYGWKNDPTSKTTR